MLNIDTRLLDKTSPDGFYLLCRITAYMNANRFCFPSNKSLAKSTGFSESKINRVKRELIEQGLISCESRFRDDKSQTSSIYKIKTRLISVFVTGEDMSELTPPLVTGDYPPLVTGDYPPLSLVTTREVLEDLSIVKFEVLKDSETSVSGDFLSDEEIEDLENKISASKATINPTPQVAPPPPPKKKRKEKPTNPAPIRDMWEAYLSEYARTGKEEPSFLPRYARDLKMLFEILRARAIKKGELPLDPVQPFRDYCTAVADYILFGRDKNGFIGRNFNPGYLHTGFNTIISSLQEKPVQAETKGGAWAEWAKRQNL